MTFAKTLKSIAFAAAFVCTAPAWSLTSAPATLVSGSATVVASEDLIGVVSTIATVPFAPAGSTSVLSTGPLTYDSLEGVYRNADGEIVTALSISQPATSVSWNSDFTLLTGGTADGASLGFQRGSRVVLLSNFTIDQPTASLFADITSNGTTYNQVLLAVADPVAAQPLPELGADGLYHVAIQTQNARLAGTYTPSVKNGNVVVTPFKADGALGLFTSGLGITSETAVRAAAGVYLGDLFIEATLAPVPEPETYLLVGAGLAAAAGVARRTRKAAEAAAA